MKAKRIPAVLFLVVLLVMSMASTAFAGTVTTTGNCGTFIEQQAQYGAGSLPDSVEIKMVVVPVVADPQNKTCEVSREPDVEEPQEPVVEEPQQPAEEEPQGPVVEEPQQPAEEEPQGPVVEEPQQPAVEEPQGPVDQPPSNDEIKDAPAGQADQSLSGLNAMEREMIEYVNQERAKSGLSQLQVDLDLARVARIKSQDMVDNGYFDHNSPTYGSPFEMMRDFGISYRAAGENIAKNGSVKGAHVSLMNSEGHRANILNPNFTHIGIGIVESSGMVTVTQMFIAK